MIVKEQVHRIDAEHKMIFFGIERDIQEAKKYLIEALLKEHFEDHSPKTKHLLEDFPDKFTAKAYLIDHFEDLFTHYHPPLFHVAHGVEGNENHPIETWTLVRIAPSPQNALEAQKLSELREKIENGSNIPLYLRSLEAKAAAKSSCGM